MTKILREGETSVEAITSRTAATHESQSQHTALPWRAVDDGYGDGDGGCWRIDPAMKDDGMASGYRWFSREDAAFIVRACNHHEALLAIVRGVAALSTVTTDDEREYDLIQAARAAVVTLEGK